MHSDEPSEKQIEILRNLRPKDRLKAAFELHEFAKIRIAAFLKQRHPDLSLKKLNDMVYERFRI